MFNLFFSDNPVVIVFVVILGLLIVATIISYILRKKNSEHDYTELKQRINSWWVMVAMFAFALLSGVTASIIFFGFISFLALKEYFSIIPTRKVDRRVLFWAYLSIPLQFYWASIGWYGMFIIFIPVYMLLFIPFRLVLLGETKHFLRAAGSIHWGLMITVFSISHLAFLTILPATEANANTTSFSGPGLILFTVLLTQLNDVAQYLWGKSLGKRAIVPHISPNKTWEGFLGGVFTTALLGTLVAPFLTPLEAWYGFLAGAIIGIAGFIGDITVSALKRELDIKDTSAMIPGHGGILDRLDSLTFTAPLFFHFVRYTAF
ncbi:phosphatidate cytidylyltransferase [Pleionea sediminis]|uniref:phosphatidate cytidylyltransferase n=1 Tax=Pleionea sediminis TaxID=2569479 RepID=UPI0011850812|nr:phosphatidate cytidylyltransferase [Pleionea sediminis]